MGQTMKAILFTMLTMCALKAQAEQVYLYIMFHDDNTNGERFRTAMESMGQCLSVIDKAKMPMPDRPSGDYEVMGAMWCGGAIERQFSGVWYRDPSKSSD